MDKGGLPVKAIDRNDTVCFVMNQAYAMTRCASCAEDSHRFGPFIFHAPSGQRERMPALSWEVPWMVLATG